MKNYGGFLFNNPEVAWFYWIHYPWIYYSLSCSRRNWIPIKDGYLVRI